MAKIYKAEVYIIDMNDEFEDIDEVANDIKAALNKQMDSLIHVVDVEESKGFFWHDDLKINKTNATKEDYDKYFGK